MQRQTNAKQKEKRKPNQPKHPFPPPPPPRSHHHPSPPARLLRSASPSRRSRLPLGGGRRGGSPPLPAEADVVWLDVPLGTREDLRLWELRLLWEVQEPGQFRGLQVFNRNHGWFEAQIHSQRLGALELGLFQDVLRRSLRCRGHPGDVCAVVGGGEGREGLGASLQIGLQAGVLWGPSDRLGGHRARQPLVPTPWGGPRWLHTRASSARLRSRSGSCCSGSTNGASSQALRSTSLGGGWNGLRCHRRRRSRSREHRKRVGVGGFFGVRGRSSRNRSRRGRFLRFQDS